MMNSSFFRKDFQLTTMIKGITLTVFLILSFSVFSQETYIYVRSGGTGGDGSFGNPYNSLQEGLDAVYATGTSDFSNYTIRLTGGTYVPTVGVGRQKTFEIKGGVTLVGGYNASYDEFNRDVINNATILSGEIGGATETDNCYHVVSISATTSTAINQLIGVIVESGYNNETNTNNSHGAGIYIKDLADLRLDACIIQGNKCVTAGSNGAGMFVEQDDVKLFLENCVFRNNSCDDSGGAIFAGDVELEIYSCNFLHNLSSSQTKGPAIYLNTSVVNFILNNSIVFDNTGVTSTNGQVWNASSATPSTGTNNIIQGFSGASNTVNGVVLEDPLFSSNAYKTATLSSTIFDLDINSPARGNALDVVQVPDDLFGESRDNTRPTIGVKEYAPPALPSQTLYYVSNSGNDLFDGSSWDKAFLTLQKALEEVSSGDTIAVYEGSYLPTRQNDLDADGSEAGDVTFLIPSGVKIFGSFGSLTANPRVQADLNARNFQANASVLEGDLGTNSAYHVVTVLNASETVSLDGFVIQNGGATEPFVLGSSSVLFGGGIYHSAVGNSSVSKLDVSNCIIGDNEATSFGGGLFNQAKDGGSCEVNLESVVFEKNASGSGGAAFYDWVNNGGTSKTTVNETDFLSNLVTNTINARMGGAFAGRVSSAQGNADYLFTSCNFFKNTIENTTGVSVNNNGGAVAFSSELANVATNIDAKLHNCLFSQNQAERGSVLSVRKQSNVETVDVEFINSTVVSNTTTLAGGGALYSRNDIQCDLINSIFHANTNSIDNVNRIFQIENSTTDVFYVVNSLLEDSETLVNSLPVNLSGQNYFELNPQFTDFVGGDYSLTEFSPGINKGENLPSGFPTLDLAGNDRVFTGTVQQVDLGAYEYQGDVCDPFVVTSLNDPISGDGVCGELRYALTWLNANASAGVIDEITFDFSSLGAVPYEINLTRALPQVSQPVKINGWSATGDQTKPGVEVSGGGVTTTTGLFLDPNCAQSEIYGMSFTGFVDGENSGLSVGADNCKIYGNYFGLDLDGSKEANSIGLLVFGNNNLIGFNNDGVDDDFERNIFSGNVFYGLYLKNNASSGVSSMANVIRGNYFGLGTDGTSMIVNDNSGVALNLSENNLIGGTTPQARNYFALPGNGHGVSFGGGAHGNKVAGNWVGFDINGDPARGINSNAILIGNSNRNNAIGNDSDLTESNRLNGKILVTNTTLATEDNRWGVNSYLDVIEFNPGPSITVQNNVMPPQNLQSMDRTLTMNVDPGAKVFIFATATDKAEEFVHVLDEVTGANSISYEIPLLTAQELVTNGYTSLTAIQSVQSPTSSIFNSSELATHVNFDFCPTPLTVTKTTDDGTCGTLRRAVDFVNTDGPNQVITFNFPDANTTIRLDQTLQLTQQGITFDGGSSGVVISPNTSFTDDQGLTSNKVLIRQSDALGNNWQNITFQNISLESVIGLQLKGNSSSRITSSNMIDFQFGIHSLDDSNLEVIDSEIYSALENGNQADAIYVATEGSFTFSNTHVPYMRNNGITVARAFSGVTVENSSFGTTSPLGIVGLDVPQPINLNGVSGLPTSATISNNKINGDFFGAIAVFDHVNAVITGNTITNGKEGVINNGTGSKMDLSQNLISNQVNVPITNPEANGYVPIIEDVDDLSGGNYLIGGELPDTFEPNGPGGSFDFRIEIFVTNTDQAEVFITSGDFNSTGEWQFDSVSLDPGSYTHLTATATYQGNTSPLSAARQIAGCSYVADAGLDQAICADASTVTLQASISGGSIGGVWAKGDLTYDGNIELTVDDAIPYNLGVNDQQSDSLFFVFTPTAFPDVTCEVVPDTVTIVINEIPEVNILDITTSCNEDYFLTTGSGADVDWYKDVVSASSLAFADTVQLSDAGTYIASFTSAEGCAGTDVITLSDPLFIPPVVSINSPDETDLCNGSITLESSGVPALSVVEWYEIMNVTVLGLENNYLVSEAGAYYFKIETSEGCEVFSDTVDIASCAPEVKDSSLNVLTNELFSLEITELATDRDGMLNLSSVVFSNEGPEGNWSIVGSTIQFAPALDFTGTITVNYTIEDNDALLSNVGKLTLNYSDDPCNILTNPITVSTNDEVCSGIVNLSIPDVSGVDYAWSYEVSNNFIVGADLNSYDATLGGEYFVTYSGLCSGETSVIIESGESVAISKSSGLLVGAVSVPGSSYQWYVKLPDGDREIVGATDLIYEPFFDGEYYLQVNFEGNCTINSEVFVVNDSGRGELFKAGLEITEDYIVIPEDLMANLTIFPNPSNGSTLTVDYESYENGIINLSLHDVSGSKVAVERIVKLGLRSTIPLGRYELQPGVYHLLIEQNGVQYQERIIIY